MRKLVAVMAVAGLLASGCGKSSKSASTTTAATGGAGGSGLAQQAGLKGTTDEHGSASVAAGGTVTVELHDVYFQPTYIKAPSGAKITLVLKNVGKLPHTFTLDAGGVDEKLSPGETKSVSLNAPAQLSGAFHCRFHQGSGMQGGFIAT
ncbi:MAG: cytochrome [Acidimicrobiales bacterium]|nr:cytochrome [Acidimicrobiales bacterium]